MGKNIRHRPVIPANQESRGGGSQVQSQLGQLKTLSQREFLMGWGCKSVVEHNRNR